MRFRNLVILAFMLISFTPGALRALEIMRSTHRFDHDKPVQLPSDRAPSWNSLLDRLLSPRSGTLELFTSLTSGPWRKICQTDRRGKSVLCRTSQETRVAHSGTFVLSISVWEERREQNSTRHLRIDFPTGVSVADGVKLSLDQRRLAVGGFDICGPATCRAELQLSDADLSLLRSGSRLAINFVSANGMKNETEVGLEGLARALDETPPTSADLVLEQRKMCLQLCEKLVCRRKSSGGCKTCADCR